MLSCYLSCLTQQMETSLDGEQIVTPKLSKTVICHSSPSSLLFISTKLGRFEGMELCIYMNCVYSVPSQEGTCGVQRLMSGCLYLIAYPPYFLLAHLHQLANEPLGSACLCCVWICRQGLVLFLRLLCGWLEETKDFMIVQLALYPRALSPAQKADRMQLHPENPNRTPS